jgi:hypothetical protein
MYVSIGIVIPQSTVSEKNVYHYGKRFNHIIRYLKRTADTEPHQIL